MTDVVGYAKKKKQREGQRNKRFVLAGQQLCTCSTLFSLACVSSDTHKMCRPFFFFVLRTQKGDHVPKRS